MSRKQANKQKKNTNKTPETKEDYKPQQLEVVIWNHRIVQV